MNIISNQIESDEKKIILVISPQPLYRLGVKLALDKGFGIGYELLESNEMFDFDLSNNIDLIIISKKSINDMSWAKLKDLTYFGIPILVLSDVVDREVVDRTKRFGAKGLISEFSSYEEINNAVVCVINGTYYWPRVTRNDLKNEYKLKSENDKKIPSLTDRQEQVITYLKEGFSNKKIADCMNISENTVKSHMSIILKKFGVENRTRLIYMLAYQERFILDVYAA